VSLSFDAFTQCINQAQIDSTLMCPMNYDPVCGCNGITYSNSCVAQFYGGVTSWTLGECGNINSCVNPAQIDSLVQCPTIYEPVCGCDSVTYSNYCVAENYAGVTSWIPGPCITNAAACSDLVSIDFGTCTSPLGYGIIGNQCQIISGCSTISGNLNYESSFYQSLDSCQLCLAGGLELLDNSVKIYPTIVDSYFNLEVNKIHVNTYFTLFNYIGEIVLSDNIREEKKLISMQQIPSGVYVLTVIGESNKYYRIVKQ
jgi:hypothetical protein